MFHLHFIQRFPPPFHTHSLSLSLLFLSSIEALFLWTYYSRLREAEVWNISSCVSAVGDFTIIAKTHRFQSLCFSRNGEERSAERSQGNSESWSCSWDHQKTNPSHCQAGLFCSLLLSFSLYCHLLLLFVRRV